MSTEASLESLQRVRSLIAHTMLGGAASVGDTIGTITLRSHQRDAAARLANLISTNGGALLADPVGLGKTYTALAVAARSRLPIVIAIPSALREMWRDALDRCGVSAVVVTHEALSRGLSVPPSPGFVIVDEAHRLRSPSTRRYAAIADLCRQARVLLVSATPVQNRRSDLAAQLALYVGRRAWQMSDDEMGEHVVRGASTQAHGVPRLDGPHAMGLNTHDDCLDELLSLPPPIAAKDETVVVALLAYGLVHQWSSSRAALVASLERRLARGLALLSAIDAGRQPTRTELSAWTHAGDAMQLAFAELVTADVAPDDADSAALSAAIDRHVTAIRSLLRRLRYSPNPDDERAELLRRIRETHPGERIIAFCHYAETVHALRSRLMHDPGVAALTANGARIASGRVSRDVVLAQFTPRSDRRDVGPGERIDLLIATDLLSEGVNLQRASVVVHLDLPWNPARLDQRVGRARRLGADRDVVTVYMVAPPAAADRLLHVEERLRKKIGVAQRTVGIAGQILPSPIAAPPDRSLAECAGEVDARLRTWMSASPRDFVIVQSCLPAVAAVECDVSGFLALVRHEDDGPRLIADVGCGITTANDAILRALDAAQGRAAAADTEPTSRSLRQIDAWLAARAASSTIDLQAAAAARLRRATLVRVARTLARAPRHRRALLAPLAESARAIATTPLGEGAERILEALASAELPDEAWLRSIATFGALNARPVARRKPGHAGAVIAVILFRGHD